MKKINVSILVVLDTFGGMDVVFLMFTLFYYNSSMLYAWYATKLPAPWQKG